MAGPVSEKPSGPRSYRSPLRERQAAQTRETILQALADEIVSSGIQALSVAAVANRADVAERTIYRYFPNVEALLEGLTSSVSAQLAEYMGERPRLEPGRHEAPDDLAAHLPHLYEALDRIGAPARAMAIVTLARGSDTGRQRRRDTLARILEPELAHLDPAAADAMFETLYLLGGLISWFLLTRSGALDGAQAGRAAARSIQAILTDLRSEQAEQAAMPPYPGRA
ncbi:MAG: TetR/AcrR family transcriptional regulator [Acidothermaceae bacterium]